MFKNNILRRLFTTLYFCLFLICSGFSKVKLPAIISNNMVLQQESDVQIWGWGSPGRTVSIRPSWAKENFKVRVPDHGKWKLKIKTPAAGGPYRMVIKEDNELTIENILIGEVWLCSGQSNMTMPLKGFPNNPVQGATDEIVHAKNDKIRVFDVGRSYLLEPQDDLKGSWKEVNSESVANFSATAWFFGKTVQEKLGVPVGLITTSWGGSSIESWMSEPSLKSFRHVKIPSKGDIIKAPQRTPTLLFNNMLYPLIGYGMRGTIWYQGESNRTNPEQYAFLLQSMVKDWRERWDIADFPFYYLQIAPYRYFPEGTKGISSAYLREAQLNAEKMIPNSGMAILMDVGEELMIHPSDKKAAGSRLGYLALARSYGVKGFSSTGPIYKEMEIAGGVALIKFNHAEVGLTSWNKKLSLFEIAGEDRKFFPAEATITSKGVEVRSQLVKKPVAVRYAFKDFVIGDLFNNGGLPASSFRTDNW